MSQTLEREGLKLVRANGRPQKRLELDLPLVTDFLCCFLRDELKSKGFEKAVIALSGGVDSSVTTYLAARALGPDKVIALRLPYRSSSPESLAHAAQVIERLGIASETIDITAAVDGYAEQFPTISPHRKGNLMSRTRMMILFDRSAEHHALPLGTGNKTERLFGYFTWHGDDAPPLNPLGDLFKTQVWALAGYLGIPEEIIGKAPSADLVPGQTDEGDLGITYERADTIMHHHLAGFEDGYIRSLGFDQKEIDLVKRKIASTHWKRQLPISAMISSTAINEFYLRPADY